MIGKKGETAREMVKKARANFNAILGKETGKMTKGNPRKSPTTSKRHNGKRKVNAQNAVLLGTGGVNALRKTKSEKFTEKKWGWAKERKKEG